MKLLLLLFTILFTLLCSFVRADEASWYSEASTLAEGYTLITASGEVLDDERNTCASWDYGFGTALRVRNLANNRCVEVRVTDRGPNKKLYKKGRTIDLSKRAFGEIADLKQGIIQVSIERVE